MEEGQVTAPSAKIPDEVEAELKQTMGVLLLEHLKKQYQGELDIDVRYEGYTEENHIFPISIQLAEGASINFHMMQKEAEELNNIRIWPDLRTYGYDTRIRFTLYLKKN